MTTTRPAGRRPVPSTAVRRIHDLAVAYLASVAVVLLVAWIVAPVSGPLAMAALFGEHLVLGGLVFVPLALRRDAVLLRMAVLALLILGFVRFWPAWWSPPGDPHPGEPALTVMTFNLELDARAPIDTVAFLQAHEAGIVGLQELTPAVAAAIEADPQLAARYPHRSLHPAPHPFGAGILSQFPLSDVTMEPWPARLAARAETPLGTIRVLDGHPPPPSVTRGPLGLPVGIDPTERDTLQGDIHAWIDEALDGSEPVVVLGDFNTAPGEPQFATLTRSLRDAHEEVGLGPGWTYRPNALEWLGIGLVRIDLVLTGPGLRPTATSVACPAHGDHCAVRATLVRLPG